jgi:hypothetical protein
MQRYEDIKRETADVVGLRVVKHRNTRKAHTAIRDLIVQHRSLSYKQIAELLGVSRWLVYKVAVEFGVRRPRGAGSPARQRGQQKASEDRNGAAATPDNFEGGLVCQEAEK